MDSPAQMFVVSSVRTGEFIRVLSLDELNALYAVFGKEFVYERYSIKPRLVMQEAVTST